VHIISTEKKHKSDAKMHTQNNMCYWNKMCFVTSECTMQCTLKIIQTQESKNKHNVGKY